MKIGLVCPYDLGRSGGVQTVVLELAARLRAGGLDTVIVAPGETSDARVPTVDVGQTITIRANRSSNQLAMSPRVTGRVAEAVNDCDLVHIHEPFVPMVSIAALRLPMVRVATFHADPTGTTRTIYRLASAVGKRLLSGAMITAVSPVAASALRPGWGDVEIIPNGIDKSGYEVATDRHPRRVVFLGRDDPRKGLDILLDAWGLIRQRVPDAELLVVGSRRGHPPPGVRYLGQVEENTKRLALAASSVAVTPNTGGESFGLVLAEAMAAGCAVVASDLPAFRWVAQDAARLFPVGEPRRLADEVVSLLEDEALCRDLGSLAQRRAVRFDWDTVVAGYRSVYDSALDRM